MYSRNLVNDLFSTIVSHNTTQCDNDDDREEAIVLLVYHHIVVMPDSWSRRAVVRICGGRYIAILGLELPLTLKGATKVKSASGLDLQAMLGFGLPGIPCGIFIESRTHVRVG